jgi:uncharacterized membrane protein
LLTVVLYDFEANFCYIKDFIAFFTSFWMVFYGKLTSWARLRLKLGFRLKLGLEFRLTRDVLDREFSDLFPNIAHFCR